MVGDGVRFSNSECVCWWGSAAMAGYFLIGNVFCCWRWRRYCCWNGRCLLLYNDDDAMHANMLCTSQRRSVILLTGNTSTTHTASMRNQRLCTLCGFSSAVMDSIYYKFIFAFEPKNKEILRVAREEMSFE